MHTREITFEDFDGNTVTETHYFNLTKSELVMYEAEFDGGLQAVIINMVNAGDNRGVLEQMARLITMAYGVRDGHSFIKSEEATERFKQSLAYDALFMDLIGAETEQNIVNFIVATLPSEFAKHAEEATAAAKAQLSSAPSGAPVENTPPLAT